MIGDDMIKELLFSKETIEKRVKKLAKQIDKDFDSEEILIICVLKGSFVFASDLVRSIKNSECIIDFIKTYSYGNRTESSGVVSISNYPSIDINNKNVLIVEDILDSGLTLKYITNYFNDLKPKSLKTCVLLDKKERRVVEFSADYVGFEIPNKFVIGYGLDYNEQYRGLSGIYSVTKL